MNNPGLCPAPSDETPTLRHPACGIRGRGFSPDDLPIAAKAAPTKTEPLASSVGGGSAAMRAVARKGDAALAATLPLRLAAHRG